MMKPLHCIPRIWKCWCQHCFNIFVLYVEVCKSNVTSSRSVTQSEGWCVATVSYPEVSWVHWNFPCVFSPCSLVSSVHMKVLSHEQFLVFSWFISEQMGHFEGVFLKESQHFAFSLSDFIRLNIWGHFDTKLFFSSVSILNRQRDFVFWLLTFLFSKMNFKVKKSKE